ncbi:hypothetical protein [Butyrivibrio sp. MC2021]|nr:hypothetical protein [Butyrivibrio sp. MC2021]
MEFTTDIFSQFDKKWALLTAGDKENFNTMTVALLPFGAKVVRVHY